MLGSTNRPTNPENEQNGILPSYHQALRESCLTGCNEDPDPVTSRLASLSFLVKQPGGLGCILHSKCSKCSKSV